MVARSNKFRLELLGPFGFYLPSGARVDVTSKKGVAIIGLLATGRDGARSRGWLQDILWGSRAAPQAQASLRRELSNLRRQMGQEGAAPLTADHQRVQLLLDCIDIDIHQFDHRAPGDASVVGWGEFLEGIDIPGEEGFEEWLRNQRAVMRELLARQPSKVPLSRAGHSAGAALPLTGPALREGILGNVQSSNSFLNRPLLAVLPFANLTGERGNDYLAQGVAEDLTELISRLRWIPVVSPAASFAYSSESSSLQEIGAGLGARYIVEGRLRGHGHRLGLAASVSNAETKGVLWTGRWELPENCSAGDLAASLPELVGAVAEHIDDAEMFRATAWTNGDLSANDLIWRARWHHNRYTREDAEIAGALFAEALAKQPHSPEAIIQFANFRHRQIWLNRGSVDEILQLRRLAQRAITADLRDGRGYMIAGIAEVWMKHTEEAVALLEHALTLNPSLAYAYTQLGAARYLNGEPAAALEAFRNAVRLNVSEHQLFYVLTEFAMVRLMLGEWDAAIKAADQAIMQRSAYWYAHVIRIHAMVARGDTAGARQALVRLRAVKPGFRLEFIDWVPFVKPDWPEELKRSLISAGFDAGEYGGAERV